MKFVKKMVGVGLAVGTIAFAGCAPVASTWSHGPGLQLGVTPTGSVSLINSQCSLMASPGQGSPFMRTGSAAAVVMARVQQVAQIQSRLTSGIQGVEARMQGWKAIAGGGC